MKCFFHPEQDVISMALGFSLCVVCNISAVHIIDLNMTGEALVDYFIMSLKSETTWHENGIFGGKVTIS